LRAAFFIREGCWKGSLETSMSYFIFSKFKIPFHNSLFDCPASFQSVGQGMIIDPAQSNQLRDRHDLAVILNLAIPSFIIALVNPSRPITIFFTIGAVVISAFYAEFTFTSRARSHVAVKLFKGFPFNCNAPRAIVFKIFALWIKATLLQTRKYLVFGLVTFARTVELVGHSRQMRLLCCHY